MATPPPSFPSPASGPDVGLCPECVLEIEERLACGFYLRPEVLRIVAARLRADLAACPH